MRHHLRQTYGEDELRQWYDPLHLHLKEDARSLDVLFPHPFFARWFNQHVQSRFEEQVGMFLDEGFVLEYRHDGNGHANGRGNGQDAVTSTSSIDFPFGRKFTFENFITNKKNYFPVTTAHEVANNHSVQYNPFIICGLDGSGKSHLLRSIANEISKKYDRSRIFFGTLEDIINVYEVKFKNNIYKSRKFFHNFSFMFIDDFCSMKNNVNIQDEFTVLFDYFYENNKQMVFSSSKNITSCSFLSNKLKSRMERGLIVYIKNPDFHIRMEYIKAQATAKKIKLNSAQRMTLAQRFEDIRSLQGILLKLSAFNDLVSRDLREKEFDQILHHTGGDSERALKPENILTVVANHFQVARKELTGVKRHRKITLARQTAMYLCRELIGCSYPALGRIFGGKDHSTAMYAIKKIEKMLLDNTEMKQTFSKLRKECISNREQ